MIFSLDDVYGNINTCITNDLLLVKLTYNFDQFLGTDLGKMYRKCLNVNFQFVYEAKITKAHSIKIYHYIVYGEWKGSKLKKSFAVIFVGLVIYCIFCKLFTNVKQV